MEECIICFEERQEFIFYSCGHKLCSECYHKISCCPLCQSRKIEKIEVIIQPTTVVTHVPNYSIRYILCIGLSTLIFLYFVVSINSTLIY